MIFVIKIMRILSYIKFYCTSQFYCCPCNLRLYFLKLHLGLLINLSSVTPDFAVSTIGFESEQQLFDASFGKKLCIYGSITA